MLPEMYKHKIDKKRQRLFACRMQQSFNRKCWSLIQGLDGTKGREGIGQRERERELWDDEVLVPSWVEPMFVFVVGQ